MHAKTSYVILDIIWKEFFIFIYIYLYLLPQNLLQILLCLVINVEQSDTTY